MALEGAQIGAYRIERTLGAGGFGIVYVGLDVRLGRRAAIKQLLPELSGHREIVERFFNEAKAAASINHPGIVEIYDVGWHTDGSAYFAMKLLDGDSLAKRLRATGPMPAQLAATIARQVSSAVAAAHARSIVHRDLKPDNVVLVPDDEVAIGERATVLDFGIAKLFGDKPASQKTRTGMMMGTPSYMSPEQCRGAGEVDHRTDVYALGCILFEMLTGRPPFVGEGAGEILGMHQFVPPPMLRSLRPDAPVELEAVVMRTLAKHPAERFQQMSELTAALRSFATGGRSMELASLPPSLRPSSEPGVPIIPIPPGSAGSAPQLPAQALPSTFVVAPAAQPSTLTAGRGERLERAPRSGTPGARSSRRSIVLGAAAAVVIGAGVAIVAALSGGSPAKQAAAPADAEVGASPDAALIARTEPDAALIARTEPDAAVLAETGVDAAVVAPTVHDVATPARGVAPLVLDGNKALIARRWQDAIGAAQAALAIEPGHVDARRIADTARSERRSEAAMRSIADAARAKDPARAKTVFATIPETSVYYTQARIAFDNLVADHVKVVTKQAHDLAAARQCKELGELARTAGAISASARSAVEAVKCSADTRPEGGVTPPSAQCDFEAMLQKGNALVASGTHAAALAAFEQALKCRFDEQALGKAYLSACNSKSSAKAKAYFKQLSPTKQGQLSQVCVRNGIDLD